MEITSKDGRRWELTEVDRSAGFPSFRFEPLGHEGEALWFVQGELDELRGLGYQVEP